MAVVEEELDRRRDLVLAAFALGVLSIYSKTSGGNA